MKDFLNSGPKILSYKFLWIGLGVGLLYWFLESMMHITVFGQGSLLDHLLTPDIHEIWKRLSVLVLIILFSGYAQRSINIRRHTENALAERERELSRILENNPAGIMLVDAASRKISWANNNALKMIGASRETVENIQCHQHLCPSLVGNCPVLDFNNEIDHSERELLTSDGECLPILKSVTRVQYNGREHLLEAFFDLSDRKKMEQDLQQAHAELDQIFQTASVAMRLVDTEFNVLKINKTFTNLTGVHEADAVGKKCHEIFSGAHCFTENCPIYRIINHQEIIEHYIDKTRTDGKRIPCILNATPFRNREGQIVGIVESFRDITELKNAQDAIASERDKLEQTLSHLHEGVSIINDGRVIEYQNDKFRSYFGSCKGKHCHEVIYAAQQPCEPCLMKTAIETGRIQIADFETAEGRFFEKAYTPVTDANKRHKVVALWRDVTEKKVTTEAIIRAEQLAALGELAAGVAHEINNPINGIINYAQLLINHSGKDKRVREIAERQIKEGERIARIVEGLLSFARRRSEEKAEISIAEVLSDSLALTASQLRKDNINVKTDLRDGLPNIWAQAHELEQVFVNIISNARHALNEKYPLPHENKSLESTAEPVNHKGVRHVRVCFQDYGTGIPKDVINKVMNPFFTTKTEGKRTGLGLSISHGILEECGGRLFLESKEGNFTRVTIELPGYSKSE